MTRAFRSSTNGLPLLLLLVGVATGLISACADDGPGRGSGSDTPDVVEAGDVGGDAVDPGDTGDDVVPPPDVGSDSGADAGTGEDADAGTDTGTDTGTTPSRCDSFPIQARFGDEIEEGGAWVSHNFLRCVRSAHVMVVPRGTTWSIEAERLPPGTRIDVYPSFYFDYEEELAPLPAPLASSGAATINGRLSLEFTGLYGGEHVVVLTNPDPRRQTVYEIRADCVGECQRVTTRYPIVLIHGFLGLDNYFGLLDYWHDMIPAMRARGTEVFNTAADPINSSQVRSAQHWEQIDGFRTTTGARRVNLIAHSQGGLDSRIIASPGGLDHGDRIASITTIATPHGGVEIPLLELISDLANAIFAFPDFSQRTAAEFNAQYVDSPQTRYWSWSFRTCASIDIICRVNSGGEVVDSLLSVFHALVILGGGGDNDGLVSVSSARWGEHLGTRWADHMDEIGQIADPRPPLHTEPFRHRDFYQAEIDRLIAAGY